MKKAVINFSSGRYIEGQNRLRESLMATGYDGDVLFENYELGFMCPSHQKVNYGFKAFLLQHAKFLGYDLILWLDASVCVQKNIQPVFDYIKTNGYFILENVNNTGAWCNDKALAPLGITRDESFSIPHIFSGVFGFDVRMCRNDVHGLINEFYIMASCKPDAFNGHKKNDRGESSKDKRVMGHRHDQTVLSVLLWKRGMRNWIGQEERLSKWFNLSEEKHDAIFAFKRV